MHAPALHGRLARPLPAILAVGERHARIEVDARGWLRGRLERDVDDELESLRAAVALPGNARPTRGLIVADVPLFAHATAERALDELRRALGAAADTVEPPALDDARLRELLDACLPHAGLPREGLVERAGELELRPRFSGRAIALRVLRDGAGLVFQRALFPMPADEARACLAREALRWNARLLGARLALQAGELVAQTRLDARELDARRVATAARAVAAAVHHALAPLRVLAREPHVARAYAALFLHDPETPGRSADPAPME